MRPRPAAGTFPRGRPGASAAAWITTAVVTCWTFLPAPPRNAYAATFTVNSAADAVDAVPGNGVCATSSGACTLRAAVQETNARSGADAITLPTGNYALTVGGSGEDNAARGDLDIRGELTIRGPVSRSGPGAVVFGAKGWADRIIHVRTNVPVEIIGLRISGGVASEGGGIRADLGSRLTLTESAVTSNRATLGGGVFNAGELGNIATLVLRGAVSRTTISDNVASQGGGGIYNLGELTLTDVVVSANSGGDGAGISNACLSGADPNATITGSRISENVGADHNFGGGINNCKFGFIAVANSTIRGNRAGAGGGVSNAGEIRLTSSSVTGNTSPAQGGGIFNDGALTATSSTVSGNATTSGGDGGGISSFGPVTLTNTTVSANTTRGTGGGIDSESTLRLQGVTITGNAADVDGDGIGGGGGIAMRDLPASVVNTIIAGNGDNNPGAQAPDCRGPVSSDGYNLIQDRRGCNISGNDIGSFYGFDPLLGPLQANGGPTLTHALLANSRCIDAGNPAAPGSTFNACPAGDQRGVARPLDGDGDGVSRCDIGAFEVSPVGTFELSPTTSTVGVGESMTVMLAYTITDERSWRELATLEIRLRDANETILWVRFEEVTGTLGTFSLVKSKHDSIGPAFAGETRNRLETRAATLKLAETLVMPNVPDSSSVTLVLTLRFKPQAADGVYDIEVLATDDFGNRQGPELAGTVAVTR